MHFVKLNLAQMDELGDLTGFCLKEFEVCKEEKCEWINEHLMEQYTRELGFTYTGNKKMTYAIPEWLADKYDGKGGILLLDDFSRAQSNFIQASMEIMDRQEYVSWKLPKGWTVLLTTNPSDGDYLVNEMDVAQKTRFDKFGLKFDKHCWAEFAENEGIDGRCINFLLMNPEIVEDSKQINPRTMVRFFNNIRSIKDFDKELPKIQMLGEASLGDAAGLFVQFINNRLDKLMDPKDMIKEDKDDVLKELHQIIGQSNLGTYRADIASVLSTRLINYSLKYAQDNPIDKTYIDRLEFLVLNEVFGPDLGYHVIKTIFQGSSKFKGLLTRNKVSKYLLF